MAGSSLKEVAGSKDSPIETAVLCVPVTVERTPFVPSPNCELKELGVARVNTAASCEHPTGTPGWAERHKDGTVMQQHVAFFDPDHDGVIWPSDTYHGMRALGFNMLIGVLSVLIIHSFFSFPTVDWPWLFDPLFRIYVKNIHKCKHGSDSGTYDNEGRYIPQKFEDFFSKYGEGKDGLSAVDIVAALYGQRVLLDMVGTGGAIFEWFITYLLLWPEDGIIRKEDVRRVFDGSMFFEKAKHNMVRRQPHCRSKQS